MIIVNYYYSSLAQMYFFSVFRRHRVLYSERKIKNIENNPPTLNTIFDTQLLIGSYGRKFLRMYII